MKCPICNSNNLDGANFCAKCGAVLTPHSGPKRVSPLRAQNSLGIPVLTFKVGEVEFNMIKVDKGSFYRGSSLELIQREIKSGRDWKLRFPLVTIDEPFYIGETTVTQALWECVMNEKNDIIPSDWDSTKGIFNPSEYKGADLPVYNVDTNHLLMFIENLNLLTGWAFDIPSSDQWEYAARGGTLSKGYKYAGSDNIDKVAWYYENSHDLKPDTLMKVLKKSINPKTYKAKYRVRHPHSVKTKLCNELGLYDMSGNVNEYFYQFLTPNHKYFFVRGGALRTAAYRMPYWCETR